MPTLSLSIATELKALIFVLVDYFNLDRRNAASAGVRAPELGNAIDLHDAFGRFEQHLADSAVRLRETSYALGPKLTFDPDSETFGADARANQMLTREYREPFVVPRHV